MLTEEQIKNLKHGDPVIVSGTLNRIDPDGDLWINFKGFVRWFPPDRVSLPSEIVNRQSSIVNKHDPCRPFKKGDRAQVVERNGRNVTCFPVGRIKVGDIVTVAENEAGDVFVKVLTEDGHEMMAPWFMLELVTPVEEQEPYSIDPENSNVLFKCGKKFATFEDDDEAQEVCDRLNAEWRKEQKND